MTHLAVIGCTAYALNTKLKHKENLQSRTLVGQLIGYDSTNIYPMWMPTLQRVILTQDVVFMPSESGTEKVYPNRQRLHEIVTIFDISEPKEQKIEQVLSQSYVDEVVYRQSDSE